LVCACLVKNGEEATHSRHSINVTTVGASYTWFTPQSVCRCGSIWCCCRRRRWGNLDRTHLFIYINIYLYIFISARSSLSALAAFCNNLLWQLTLFSFYFAFISFSLRSASLRINKGATTGSLVCWLSAPEPNFAAGRPKLFLLYLFAMNFKTFCHKEENLFISPEEGKAYPAQLMILFIVSENNYF